MCCQSGLLSVEFCFVKGLTLEQVDALWNCLAIDPLSSDDCLNWFLSTAKSKDYHALSISTLRHIFVDKALITAFVLYPIWR